MPTLVGAGSAYVEEEKRGRRRSRIGDRRFFVPQRLLRVARCADHSSFECARLLLDLCFWAEAGGFDLVWVCFKLVLPGVRTWFVPFMYLACTRHVPGSGSEAWQDRQLP